MAFEFSLKSDFDSEEDKSNDLDFFHHPYFSSKHYGHFFSAHPQQLASKRKRNNIYKLTMKCIALLFSPRTILVQCLSFLCIFLVSHFDSGTKYTQHFGISVNIQVITLMVSFCVVFSINQSFVRRERALRDIASLKTSIIIIYYTLLHLYKDDDYKQTIICMTCKQLLQYLAEYIYDRNELIPGKLYSHSQNRTIKHFYRHINDLLTLIFAHSNNNSNTSSSVIGVLTNKTNAVLQSFENLCATKDYITPIGLRAFTAFILWVLPIILAPYFVWHTNNNISDVTSYLWAWLFFLMLAALVDVKSILDDLFDGDSIQDDIILDIDHVFENIKYGFQS